MDDIYIYVGRKKTRSHPKYMEINVYFEWRRVG
jgi:hypothetical protein